MLIRRKNGNTGNEEGHGQILNSTQHFPVENQSPNILTEGGLRTNSGKIWLVFTLHWEGMSRKKMELTEKC